MDISGVDVDFLSNEELLELCNDIVDNVSEEISVLKGVDIDNLSDDKIQDFYDDMIYGSQISDSANKVMPLTEQQVLDLNYNIIDMDTDEIRLLNGHNVNIDINGLSDDEISSLYEDALLSPNLLAATPANNAFNCTAGAITDLGKTTYGYKGTLDIACLVGSDYISFKLSYVGYGTYSYLSIIQEAINSPYSGCHYMYINTNAITGGSSSGDVFYGVSAYLNCGKFKYYGYYQGSLVVKYEYINMSFSYYK